MAAPAEAAMAAGAEEGPGVKAAEPPEALGLLELCGVCRERLRPPREPQLLPCLHSVCRECLGHGQVFQCPVCHQLCPLGDIMDNLFLHESPALAPAPQSCTSCQDNARATSFCLECAEPLCDTCVEAHLRVRYTREHSVRALAGPAPFPVPVPVPVPVPSPCPAHPPEPLSLFCSSCERLTCSLCHLGPHRGHPSQPLSEAIERQRSQLAPLLQRLGDKHSVVQRCARHLRAHTRRVSDRLKQVQVQVKLAVLQVMRELNRRGRELLSEAQGVTECHQLRLEQQHRALSRAQRLQEHALRFTARALSDTHGPALLLSGRLIQAQLLRALGVQVEPPEPPGELRFQWDPQEWGQRAQSFGAIVSELPLPPSLSPSPTPQVSGEGQVSPEGSGDRGQECHPPEGHLPVSPEQLGTQPEPGGGSSAESAGGSREAPPSPPREEKFVKKLLIKRSLPPCPSATPVLPKQPRVTLERLQLDLELDPARPPLFRIFPGPSARDFSVIVIERGTRGGQGTPGGQGTQGTAGTQGTEGTAGTEGTEGMEGTEGTEGTAAMAETRGALPVKEEQLESPIGDSADTKPALLLLPPAPGVPAGVPEGVPAGVPGVPGCVPGVPGCVPGVPAGVPGVPGVPAGVPGVPEGVPGVSCCQVCGQAGPVVMCDRCQRCFHLQCHLPALHDVPSPLWRCSLCLELPPPSPGPGPAHKLSPHQQQRCELVLLQLLCHEPWRPLQRLCSSRATPDVLDLTLIRARLQEKLPPPYSSPAEFAGDAWRLLRELQLLTEDKEELRALLELQGFLQSRLRAAFGEQHFCHVGLGEPPEGSQGC